MFICGERIIEGLIVAATPDTMRVALPGESDLADLRCVGEEWVLETEQPAEAEYKAAAMHAGQSFW